MHFIHQPSDHSRLAEYLRDGLSARWDKFRAAVAFVRRSGVRQIEDSLATFSSDRDVEIIAGIDHRGTTYEGLEILLEAVAPRGRVLICHNPGYRTFHPKIYLFKSSNSVDAYVGSGNLTGGGLISNYEAGIRVRLNLAIRREAAFSDEIEATLDQWADPASGIVAQLDKELLNDLHNWGLVPSEATSNTNPDERYTSALSQASVDFPFSPQSAPGLPTSVAGVGPLIAPSPVVASGFLMTLQTTDVGVGQTTAGTSKRSPEIFIPLAARDMYPLFWEWPAGFSDDPGRPGKKDRNNVRIRLSGQTASANIMYWPVKHDFRIRSAQIRDAGTVGDILRVERAVSNEAEFDYYVEIIPKGTILHPIYLALCNNPVRNSMKRFGYY